ncbi:GRIP and coiled-coil domain-containing protein 2 [Drosophila bipectinata]|uniref:GRIP and coiled-coil domain-containing protein 2 n=1 Tax=Drosophila bipectinata TaxID=42026 RepID=UPI001C89DD15|nr:GRIP and coiled-coil domain-containing protein 2 [Drosophila bipectinata]
MDTASPREGQKNANPIEALSKDEIINKYKGLLNIAKKAKQAKDELTEENRLLKEALKRAAEKQSSLPAMQEMLQDFTDKNLILTEQLNSLKAKNKEDAQRMGQLEIENESLKRQLGRLSDENDELLADVERMEKAMHQVNLLGNEQRKNLELLETDIEKIKKAEAENNNLRQQLATVSEESALLQEKYQGLKEINSEQRKKFNSLKDRFIDVHRKLKGLKECKCVLLETQHEYAASVSKWQVEIIKASQLLCSKMTSLQAENEKLKQSTGTESSSNGPDRKRLLLRIHDLERLAKIVKQQQQELPKSQLDVEHVLNKLNTIEKLAAIVKEQQNVNKEQRDQNTDQHSNELDLSLFQQKNQELQDHIESLEKECNNQRIKIQDLEAICVELRQHNEDLLARFGLKEQENDELLAEMRELNEALKGRGDAISRLQEQHEAQAKREHELEEQLSMSQQATLEKSLKLDQLQGRIDELEQANADAQSDVLSTSTISRAEELSRLRELEDGYEEKYHKLRALAAKLKKKLQEQTQQLQEMEQGGALKQELEAVKMAQVQLQQDLNAARAENQKLRSKEKAKHSHSNNVLNLEIEAAEKSLADVSAKLAAKSNELEAVKESLTSRENTVAQLRKEIAILEEAKNGEAEHSRQLKEQINRMQVQVKDAVHGKQQALNQNKELEQGVEKAKMEAEQLRLQLAESAQQYESKLMNETQLLEARTVELEAHMAAHNDLENALKTAERAQEDMRVEYTEYKLKAQAVLRKNQNKGSNREQELEEELTSFRESERKLRESNDGRAARLAQLDGQLEAMQQDNAALQKRSKELSTLVDELRQQNDLLTLENQRQMQFQQDLMQKHRLQVDQLEAAHQTKVKQLHQQLEESHKEQANASNHSNTSGFSGEPSPEQAKIDYLLQDHDTSLDASAGEVSLAQLAAQRKISTASRRSHDFMPLDELLNTSMNQITSDTVTTISNFGRSVSQPEEDDMGDYAVQSAQLQATKERLGIQESRIKHLTALLAENEQDLAKLTQMNDMLKEELRRQERSEEREQHMHNSEYLKNVFIKFLTLNNADERQRLVPVLNTILRLSRNEMEMLNCVAKGQKVSPDGSTRSWTGFLTAWGGNNNNSN